MKSPSRRLFEFLAAQGALEHPVRLSLRQLQGAAGLPRNRTIALLRRLEELGLLQVLRPSRKSPGCALSYRVTEHWKAAMEGHQARKQSQVIRSYRKAAKDEVKAPSQQQAKELKRLLQRYSIPVTERACRFLLREVRRAVEMHSTPEERSLFSSAVCASVWRLWHRHDFGLMAANMWRRNILERLDRLLGLMRRAKLRGVKSVFAAAYAVLKEMLWEALSFTRARITTLRNELYLLRCDRKSHRSWWSVSELLGAYAVR